MGRLKLIDGGRKRFGPKSRKVVFSDRQMLLARDTKKFKTHREFVDFLFRGQHKCKVEDHARLKYYHSTKNDICMTTVIGEIGASLVEM